MSLESSYQFRDTEKLVSNYNKRLAPVVETPILVALEHGHA